jgi:hypothetical protein
VDVFARTEEWSGQDRTDGLAPPPM